MTRAPSGTSLQVVMAPAVYLSLAADGSGGVGGSPAAVGNPEFRPNPEVLVAASRREAGKAGQELVISVSAADPIIGEASRWFRK